ncbi:leukocyte immunoglobulin-like receptor subfamily B member 3A [Microtus ochrogaster]|uniref:Leukocyte immunoglobulin-like receptor subfamily B member 3A n=1 Tax=Microtus ochrogaster TaxID=79684 RepID=A0ABM1TWI1_MICOH|nr:leukocyte immunoglobulin-like receptor subfamily B member 3A [Microtus ochrogaster]
MRADAVKLKNILGQSIGIQSLMSYGIDIDFLAGSLPNPVLRAEPGSVVANGSQVTVICEGTPGARDYYLYQIGNQGSLQRLTPIKPGNIAKFLIPIIQWSHAGRYLCFYHKPPRWSKKSNTLELVVTGYLLPKPMLSSLTSLVVTSGEIMTFQCASWERYNGFVLTKEDEKFSRLQDSQYINSTEQFQALFHTGPVTVSHTGIFRCYGYKNSTYMWSNPSDSLEIHIAGQLHDTPTLSVLPGSRMSSGEDVTLVCQSSHRRDSFVLSKEGTAHSLLYLRSVLQDKLYQAKFFMRNVTFTHGGTYKCYSSEDLYPYLLSYPSNAVELVVSGSSADPDSLSKEPIPTFDWTYTSLDSVWATVFQNVKERSIVNIFKFLSAVTYVGTSLDIGDFQNLVLK